MNKRTLTLKQMDKFYDDATFSTFGNSKYTIFSRLDVKKMNDILKAYKHWAKSHTPTWETDNLVGNILGWPKDYKGLFKPQQSKLPEEFKLKYKGVIVATPVPYLEKTINAIILYLKEREDED